MTAKQVLALKINPLYEKLASISTSDFNKLKESIKQKGLIESIKVNQDHVILDGHHRYKICQELGKEIKIQEYTFENPIEELEFVKETLKRRHMNPFQKVELEYNFIEIYRQEAWNREKAGVKQPSFGNPKEGHGKSTIGYTTDKIAEAADVDPQTAWYAIKILEKNYHKEALNKTCQIIENSTQEEKTKEGFNEYLIHINEFLYQYGPQHQNLIQKVRDGGRGAGIETSYQIMQDWDRQIQQEIEKSRPKTDKEIMQELQIPIRAYDVWNFPNRNKSYGKDWDGAIAAEIVFNTLYFFTKQGDMIVDPMAGGGVVGPVCDVMRRQYEMYDKNPAEGMNIIRRDVLKEGFPTTRADLVFWDPPYYKKKEEQYGEDAISALNKKEYLDVFRTAAKQLRPNTKILALLMGGYRQQNIEDEDNQQEENIFIWDYVEIFKKAGWIPAFEIHCDYSQNLISPAFIGKLEDKRKLGRLTRSLLIMKGGMR